MDGITIGRRTLLRGGAAFAATSLFPVAAFAEAPLDPRLAVVAPELRAMAAKQIADFDKAPPWSRAYLATVREMSKTWQSTPLADVPYEQRKIAGPKGDVGVVIVNARAGSSDKTGGRPGVLHTHGGGYILGTAMMGVADLQATAKALDIVIVSVDYTLAPEATYATSIEENYAGLKWLHANAEALGVDPARLAVMGESAGGGHAALLALTARDRGEVPLVFQCLTYPMLDDRTGSSVTPPPPMGAFSWTAGANRLGWECFLGMAPGGASVPPRAVPARAASLAGLPPAWIGVGSIDLFADEDLAYARRLADAGVPVELNLVPGAYHGFDGGPASIPLIGNFRFARLTALRRGLGL